MTVRTPSYLKARFENGDIPNAIDYEDVFDSFFPLLTSALQTIAAPMNFTQQVYVLELNSPLVSAVSVISSFVSAQTVNAAFVNADAVSAVSVSATSVNASIVSADSLYASSVFSVSGNFYQRAIDVSALATTQAGALLVNGLVTFVIQADKNNNAVRLPTSDRGRMQTVINASTTVIKIFPATSGRFVTTAVNASLNIPEGRSAQIFHKGDDRYGIMIG